MPRSFPKVIAATIAAATAVTVAPSTAHAEGFACSASAVRANVLGQAADPVHAGAADACPTTTQALDALGAPLAGGAASARTGTTGDSAGAAGTLSGFSAGSLGALTPELPRIALPPGIDALEVPLPASAQLLGLPSSIVVDATRAAQDLVDTRTLADVPLMAADLVNTAVSAACRTGDVVFDALSQVEGLEALGRALPTDRAVDTSMPLVDGQTVVFSAIDLAKVDLPGGLSVTDPLVGSVLRTALQDAVAKLPTVSVPAEVARVVVEPAHREEGSNALQQFGPRVRISALGRELADVTLGDALVSALGDVCTLPAAIAGPPAPLSPATEQALACATSDIVLTDVVEKDGKVKIVGLAAAGYVGRTVDIVLSSTGKRVAQAVVEPDGFFRTRAPLPPRSIRFTNDARYQAVAGTERSLALKLHRRMRISRMKPGAGTLTITGRIYGRMGDDEVVITRRVSCTKHVEVATVKPDRDGRWRITLPVPEGVDAATFRATTTVTKGRRAKEFRTFSLPGHVAL